MTEKDMGMDKIDEGQQRQIDTLSVWTKVYGFVFVVVLALFIGGVIAMPFLMAGDHNRCPHPECVHYKGIK